MIARAVAVIQMLLIAVVTAGEDTLDFTGRLGKIAPENQFSVDGHFVWCGSPIRGEDGRFYLFYSRWPAGTAGRAPGDESLFRDMKGWMKYSEIAAAVSDSPAGPFRHLATVLRGSGDPSRWDCFNAHNPHIQRFDGRIYLYHIANNTIGHKDRWMSHADGQRVGVVVADSVADLLAGRFRRSDRPLIEPDGNRTFCRTVNPGVTRGRDGRYLMMFKSRSAPSGGHMTHWIASADKPDGPFELTGPALTDARYDAEDPCFWYDKARDRYYAIVKDFSHSSRALSPQFGALALVTSEQGWGDWKPAAHPLVSLREFTDTEGRKHPLANLERPQLLFDDQQNPVCLFAAAGEQDPFKGTPSFNMAIPIRDAVSGKTVIVRDGARLDAALRYLEPGAVIRIAPGIYQPGVSVRDAHGSAEAPITIEALDPEHPPVFEGGNEAWHLTDVSHFTLRGLVCRKQKNNGINIDDGGSFETPSEHVTLDQLHIEDTGPDGNFDAIKCSGVDHLKITRCRISGWGGQAIDFVGCHHAEISDCEITGKPGFSQHTGPQFKGGCSEVWMHHCRLTDTGQRPVQIGGSTGLEYFRPKDAPYEARAIRVEDNLIIGGDCAVAFTGADRSSFSHNTIVRPEKWIMRILQESREPRFVRCGDNSFSNNLIVFERSKVRTIANIGPDTRAESFTFSGNHWFAADAPAQSRPDLPAAETEAVHGVDPDLDWPDHTPRKNLTAGARPKVTLPLRR